MKRGFTLLEIILAIVILSILAITAIPRMNMGIQSARLEMATNKVATDLKYARDFAMSHNRRTKAAFNFTDETYSVYENVSGIWQILQDPSTREDFKVALNSGNYNGIVIMIVQFDGASAVEFDSLGRPYAGENPLRRTGYVLLYFKQRSLPLNALSVTVTPVTGKIQIDKWPRIGPRPPLRIPVRVEW